MLYEQRGKAFNLNWTWRKVSRGRSLELEREIEARGNDYHWQGEMIITSNRNNMYSGTEIKSLRQENKNSCELLEHIWNVIRSEAGRKAEMMEGLCTKLKNLNYKDHGKLWKALLTLLSHDQSHWQFERWVRGGRLVKRLLELLR